MSIQSVTAAAVAETEAAHRISYLLWSNKHSAWWKPAAWGYTSDRAEAGRFTEEEAIRYVVASAQCGLLSGVSCMVASPDNWNRP